MNYRQCEDGELWMQSRGLLTCHFDITKKGSVSVSSWRLYTASWRWAKFLIFFLFSAKPSFFIVSLQVRKSSQEGKLDETDSFKSKGSNHGDSNAHRPRNTKDTLNTLGGKEKGMSNTPTSSPVSHHFYYSCIDIRKTRLWSKKFLVWNVPMVGLHVRLMLILGN